ncbi:MAG TPA: phytanoyl-CoA dioxygenase family protein [Vicinamibacteria bacterium]|jgi:hypothetical protein
MIRIFKDEARQQAFERDGFVKLELLRPEDMKELEDYYLSLTDGKVQNTVYGMWVSLHDEHADIEAKRKTMEHIHRIVLPRLNEHFIDCKPHLGSYLVKVPNPKSFTFPHQDWTFVDNEQLDYLCSLTIWITLKDIDIPTGTLGFIKGSPKFFDNVIGSPSPAITTLTRGHEPLLFQYLTYPKVGAGDALAFNNKTIHAALPNTGNYQRIALGIGITPARAELFHYYLKPGTTNRLLKLKVEEEFFVQYSNQALYELYMQGRLPGYSRVVGELDYDFTAPTAEEIVALCLEHGGAHNGMTVDLRR